MTILLIEDDHIEVLKLNRSIAKLGQEHEVVEAGNGEEALTYLGAHITRFIVVRPQYAKDEWS